MHADRSAEGLRHRDSARISRKRRVREGSSASRVDARQRDTRCAAPASTRARESLERESSVSDVDRPCRMRAFLCAGAGGGRHVASRGWWLGSTGEALRCARDRHCASPQEGQPHHKWARRFWSGHPCARYWVQAAGASGLHRRLRWAYSSGTRSSHLGQAQHLRSTQDAARRRIRVPVLRLYRSPWFPPPVGRRSRRQAEDRGQLEDRPCSTGLAELTSRKGGPWNKAQKLTARWSLPGRP